MSNLETIKLVTLDITRKKYLFWMLHGEIHINAKNIRATIN